MPEPSEDGYSGRLHSIRKEEYSHVAETYLDYAGACPYPLSALTEYTRILASSLYGNPHSGSGSSLRSTLAAEKARSLVLKLFNADPAEYSVVFIANATAALKLVGEGFGDRCRYVYHKDSHTSAVGLSRLAHTYQRVARPEEVIPADKTVVCWSGQSNFSGERHDSARWADLASDSVYTLLDAAALSTTSPPDLTAIGVDFAVVSFYKMFGHPDLGALILKTERGVEFFKDRKYFGGGTVESLALDYFPRKRELAESLEDGTLPFHSLVALIAAIEQYTRIYGSFASIRSHANSVALYAHSQLASLRHANGARVCDIYSTGCYSDPAKQGPIVSFNLLDSCGSWIGYSELEKVANASNISIRTGTLCNSGATSQWIGITDSEIVSNHRKGHICNDGNDIMDGKPTGAVRISMGAASSREDVDRFLELVVDHFVNRQRPNVGVSGSRTAIVESITIFPIKSCGGYSVSGPWKILPEGFKFDRQFCLVERTKMQVMSLKKHKMMALVKPSIIDDCILRVDFKGSTINIALGNDDTSDSSSFSVSSGSSAGSSITGKTHARKIAVCGDNTEVLMYEDAEIISFFSTALGVDCTLAKMCENASRFHKPNVNGPLTATGAEATNVPITMSNASPILLISRASVRHLGRDIDDDVFRANIVVSGSLPYAEDQWNDLIIGASRYKVSIRNCWHF